MVIHSKMDNILTHLARQEEDKSNDTYNTETTETTQDTYDQYSIFEVLILCILPFICIDSPLVDH